MLCVPPSVLCSLYCLPAVPLDTLPEHVLRALGGAAYPALAVVACHLIPSRLLSMPGDRYLPVLLDAHAATMCAAAYKTRRICNLLPTLLDHGRLAAPTLPRLLGLMLLARIPRCLQTRANYFLPSILAAEATCHDTRCL